MRYHIIITFKNEKPSDSDKDHGRQYALDVDADKRADALQQGQREAQLIKGNLRDTWFLEQITVAPVK